MDNDASDFSNEPCIATSPAGDFGEIAGAEDEVTSPFELFFATCGDNDSGILSVGITVHVAHDQRNLSINGFGIECIVFIGGV
jgi:hypothetical protein